MCARISALCGAVNTYSKQEGFFPSRVARVIGMVKPIFEAIGAVLGAVCELVCCAGRIVLNTIGLVTPQCVYNFLKGLNDQAHAAVAARMPACCGAGA